MEVVFWYVDPWDATHDGERSYRCDAETEEEAVRQFREEFGEEHVVQCVIREK